VLVTDDGVEVETRFTHGRRGADVDAAESGGTDGTHTIVGEDGIHDLEARLREYQAAESVVVGVDPVQPKRAVLIGLDADVSAVGDRHTSNIQGSVTRQLNTDKGARGDLRVLLPYHG